MTIWLTILLILGGLMIPLGSLDGELTTLCATIFGLIAAGLFPAISLLVSAPVPTSFSVQRIEKLSRASEQLVQKLLNSLAFILAGGVALLLSTFDLKIEPPSALEPPQAALWLEWVRDAPERVVQGIAFATLVMALDRLRLVAGSFLYVRTLRFEIAIAEAKERLADAGASAQTRVAEGFATPKGFGRRIELKVADEQSSGD